MSDKCKANVVGFMFDRNLDHVALIRKLKPSWQCGKLNGIGGRIKGNEIPLEALMRIFREEVGITCPQYTWAYIAKAKGSKVDGFYDSELHVYAGFGDLSLLKSTTDEKIEIISTHDVCAHNCSISMIEDLPWIIALAVDILMGRRAGSGADWVEIQYPVKCWPEEK